MSLAAVLALTPALTLALSFSTAVLGQVQSQMARGDLRSDVRSDVLGDGIPTPLTDTRGDAARGKAIVGDRQTGLCLLCHSGPFPEPQLHGNLAPSLNGAGSRWSAAQLRLRIVDSRSLNPDSLMPALHRSQGLQRVGAAWQGRPVLDAQQVEDVVAYLETLK